MSSKPVSQKNQSPELNSLPEDRQKEKRLYDVHFFHTWCKQCGLCMAFCPKKIITADKNGNPQIADADRCTGCRFCEMHCPDFAITVDDRVPQRRKSDESDG